MTIAVTTLIENTLTDHNALHCEHGLSFHIRTPDRTFLFDCGATDNFLRNAQRLNIDLRDIDFAVCSHAHFDHCGGLAPLIAITGLRRLITGRDFFAPKYAVTGMRHGYVGVDFDERFLTGQGVVHDVCGDLLEIGDGIWLVGNFERAYPEEAIPEKFKVLRDGEFVPDEFPDEICLALPMEDGLAVVAGCSHPGVLNMVKTVRDRLGLPVRGVWGGTHLKDADSNRVDQTIAELKRLGVRHLGLSHCSGDHTAAACQNDPDLSICRLGTGNGVFLR